MRFQFLQSNAISVLIAFVLSVLPCMGQATQGSASLDVVVVPRREFLSADFPSLERDYVVLLSARGGRDAGPRRRTDRGAR